MAWDLILPLSLTAQEPMLLLRLTAQDLVRSPFLKNCIFSIIFYPTYTPYTPCNHHTVVHVHESFFLFA